MGKLKHVNTLIAADNESDIVEYIIILLLVIKILIKSCNAHVHIASRATRFVHIRKYSGFSWESIYDLKKESHPIVCFSKFLS